MASREAYTITIKTGERLFLASDARLELVLYSSDGRHEAGPFRLKSPWSLVERHHGNATEIYTFDDMKNIGDIAAVKLTSSRGLRPIFNSLFINQIHVRQTARGIETVIPVYSWIRPGTERYFFGGDGRIPNDPRLPSRIKEYRAADIAFQATIYNSATFARIPDTPVGLCSNYLSLPMDEQFDSIKATMVFTSVISTMVEQEYMQVLNGGSGSWDSYDEIKELFGSNGRLLSNVARNWYTDETMGKQYLNGINPYLIKLVKGSFPSDFPVSEKTLSSKVAVLHGKNIHSEIASGKFCYLDYNPMLAEFVDVLNKERAAKKPGMSDRYLAAPFCLFYYVDAVRTIVPVAIQLKKGGKTYYPTAADDSDVAKNEWILAKIWVNAADAQIHQLVTHFMSKHMITEAFALATHRALSPAHPLMRLLKPNLLSTMAINALARQRLLPQIQDLFSIGDQMIPLVQRAFSFWTVESMSPIVCLETNGFDSNTKSPLVDEDGVYPWREDVLLVYDAIKSFVTEYVHIYYKGDDKLVAGDNELSSWRNELLAVLPGKSIPEINSQKVVIELVTNLIYTASAGHSAINFNQYEYYSFVPNHPARMRLPIPEELGKPITTQVILDSLPNKTQSVQSMALAKSLSEYSNNEVFLGKPAQDTLHSDSGARITLEHFVGRLEEIQETIKARNNCEPRKQEPYVWLMPHMITNSIAI
ncbi:Lipoxygenase domain-containing protein [Plasmodiophora brassicae]|uniref:Lipoxygenase domain-containing protein n=1 Tax=Plasmodiophora brassicae TaxID=37360 RepID=A0A3P3YBX0_PLABS|nr:unnamed protein product [Plasmodiophora brassicae]